METYALFEDGTASRLVFDSFDTSPQDDPVRLAFPDIEDAQVRNSARNGCLAAYHLLSDLGYLRRGDRFFYSCQFAEPWLNLAVQGDSAGLAFCLKLVQEVNRLKGGKTLDHAIAATGVITDSTRDARVEPVRSARAKIAAAVERLEAGGRVFYPAGNQGEIDPTLSDWATGKGVQLIPVSSVAQAIEELLSLKKAPKERRFAYRAAVVVAVVLPMAVGGYFLYDSAGPPQTAFPEEARVMAPPPPVAGLAQRLQGKEGLGLAIDLHYLGASGRGTLAVDAPSAPSLTLHYGDQFKIACRTTQPCYLQIYQIDSHDRVDRLPDPTPEAQPLILSADATYYFPAALEDWHRVDAVEGEETLHFVASRYPDRELEESYRLYRQVPEEQKQEFSRRLQQQLQGRAQMRNAMAFYTSFRFQHDPVDQARVARDGPDLWILGKGYSEVLFVSDRTGDEEIYAMNADGNNQNNLTRHPSSDRVPCWSPDGTRFAFTSNREGNQEIYVSNLRGTEVQNLTRDPGWDSTPSWSPDGTQIIFQSNRGNADPQNYDLYVMNAAGSGVRPLLATPFREQQPAFSPDGQQIAYVRSTTFDDQQLYLMNADGTAPRPLQPGLLPLNTITPRWSPDGRQIACTGLVPGTSPQLFLIDADQVGGLRQLTHWAEASQSASFSPDGTRLLLCHTASLAEASYRIYEVSSKGGQLTRLTHGRGNDSEPVWSEGFRSIGAARVGERAERQMAVENRGNRTLVVSQVRFDDRQFVANPEQFEVPAGERQEVKLSFVPNQEGTHYTTLKVLSNDPDDPEIRLILNGRGEPAALAGDAPGKPGLVKVSEIGGS